VHVSEGSLNQSIVHPREVFNVAVRESAAAIILLHNHPTGDPTPSQEDLDVTHRLHEVGELMGIKVLDHIIIGEKAYYSFADRGLM
jgi:DNA repair protein RadC